jgi:hypothetical protein
MVSHFSWFRSIVPLVSIRHGCLIVSLSLDFSPLLLLLLFVVPFHLLRVSVERNINGHFLDFRECWNRKFESDAKYGTAGPEYRLVNQGEGAAECRRSGVPDNADRTGGQDPAFE